MAEKTEQTKLPRELRSDREFLQSNAMVEGRYDYSSCQLNVLFCVLASLKRNDPPDKIYRINVNDLTELTGNSTFTYQHVAENVKQMQTRTFEIRTKNGYTVVSPFDRTRFESGSPEIEIVLGRTARAYYFGLKEQFTVGGLKSVLSCPSKYAKRIYMMCEQWRKKVGKFTIAIPDLKEKLGLRDVPKKGSKKPVVEQLPIFADFRKNVLDVAEQQINERTNIKIKYTPIKSPGSRTYTHIEFRMSQKDVVQPEINFDIPVDDQLELKRNKQLMYAFGVHEPHQTIIAQVMSDKSDGGRARSVVQETLMDVEAKNRGGNINTKAGYLVSELQRKGIIKVKI